MLKHNKRPKWFVPILFFWMFFTSLLYCCLTLIGTWILVAPASVFIVLSIFFYFTSFFLLNRTYTILKTSLVYLNKDGSNIYHKLRLLIMLGWLTGCNLFVFFKLTSSNLIGEYIRGFGLFIYLFLCLEIAIALLALFVAPLAVSQHFLPGESMTRTIDINNVDLKPAEKNKHNRA